MIRVRKISALIGIAALVVCLPMLVVAGDFHNGASLVCSDCHTMHYSQQHGYNSDGTGFFTALGGGPHHYLLRNEVNELCLTCHDGSSFAPDVYGANSNSYVRQAGALNKVGDGHEATGHTLNSTAEAPGSNPAWSTAEGLECTNCHYPHGSASYRNVAADQGNYAGLGRTYSMITYASGTQDLTKDVFQTAAGPMSVHYAYNNVQFNEPDETKSAYANWCKGCHTDFHGLKGGLEVGGATGEEWLRHPNADANIGAMGGGHSALATFTAKTNKVHVMSASGVIGAADNSPSCMSCHKAHGNQNSFGLIFMAGTGTVTEQGDDGTAMRSTCKQCHRQGG
ncbi:MAG TPA: hypothetical protein VFX92_12090 [Candidatus Krumholzibacteria bacterium]|nr:hypothetical protein [Candidatus Krumholzibacteria bacterium]